MKSVTLKKLALCLLWSSVIIFSLYYIYANCFRYFILDPKHYHFDFFWPRKYWLFTHVVSGIIATLVAPFQFVPLLRIKNIKVHRLLGRAYVYGIIVSSVTSFYLCATTPENIWYALGLGGFTLAWLVTAVTGMVKAIKGKMVQHKEWMIRSFVVTIGFSVSRLLEDLIIHANMQVNRVDRLTILSWISWMLPLMVTEWAIARSRKEIQKPGSLNFSMEVEKKNIQALIPAMEKKYCPPVN